MILEEGACILVGFKKKSRPTDPNFEDHAIGNTHIFFFCLMGTNGQLFPLTDNTDGAAVDQVQQQHLFISKLHRLTLG